MKQEFLPYYLSRAALSAGFSILVLGFSWRAILFTAVLFSLFIIYLHSGWFTVNPDSPFTPLRRDSRGMEIQRIALIFAVTAGMAFYLISPYLSPWMTVTIPGSLGIAIGISAYFIIQFFLFTGK